MLIEESAQSAERCYCGAAAERVFLLSGDCDFVTHAPWCYANGHWSQALDLALAQENAMRARYGMGEVVRLAA